MSMKIVFPDDFHPLPDNGGFELIFDQSSESIQVEMSSLVEKGRGLFSNEPSLATDMVRFKFPNGTPIENVYKFIRIAESIDWG